MADSLCGGLSNEKDSGKDSSERVKRSWRKSLGTRKAVPETEMAETLGCYDGQCGKEEPREHSGEPQHLTARAPFVLPWRHIHLLYKHHIFLIFIRSLNTLEWCTVTVLLAYVSGTCHKAITNPAVTTDDALVIFILCLICTNNVKKHVEDANILTVCHELNTGVFFGG